MKQKTENKSAAAVTTVIKMIKDVTRDAEKLAQRATAAAVLLEAAKAGQAAAAAALAELLAGSAESMSAEVMADYAVNAANADIAARTAGADLAAFEALRVLAEEEKKELAAALLKAGGAEAVIAQRAWSMEPRRLEIEEHENSGSIERRSAGMRAGAINQLMALLNLPDRLPLSPFVYVKAGARLDGPHNIVVSNSGLEIIGHSMAFCHYGHKYCSGELAMVFNKHNFPIGKGE